MPELPEVESVRATLEPCLLGHNITHADLRRAAYASSFDHNGLDIPTTPHALLQDATIAAVLRKGKQLALLATDGRVACLHLGMSGVISAQACSPAPASLSRPDRSSAKPDHVHVIWTLSDGSRILFADPRRFGGVWTFPTLASLHTHRWNALGPDALDLSPHHLHAACATTRRSIKAVLLDQSVAAGIGNIYADESLFAAGIDPRTRALALTPAHCATLTTHLHRILRDAIRAGGSTLRDYRDASGAKGSAQHAHSVYGRAGKPCPRCGSTLRDTLVAQRTTVWCPKCQPRLRATRRPSRPARSHSKQAR